MMILQFADLSKLRTKKAVFEDFIPALDPNTLEQLKELTSRRRVIEESINETSSITEAIAREMSGGLTSQCEQDIYKLKKYLPLLENLVFHVEKASSTRDVGRWISRLKIQWSSAVVGTSAFSNIMGPKYFQVNNIRFELGMTLYLYAATLRERAFEMMPIDLVLSTTLFREAAGVYDYLSLEFLPCLQSASAGQRPPEATSSFVQVMSLICLAEAQAVTIKKAEEKSTSANLLAKLHHGVTQYLGEAASILNSGSAEVKDISSRFFEYVNCCKAVHELWSEKYFAENIKEGRGQIGVAIGILHQALENIEKKIPGEEAWRVVMKKEMDSVAEMVIKFQKENEFVWHQKIASGDELPVFNGSKIVTPIPYQPTRLEEPLAFKK